MSENLGYIESEIVDGNATNHIPTLNSTNTDIQQQREIYELETRLYELERDIRQFLTNEAQLKRNYNDLREFQVSGGFFEIPYLYVF